MRRYLQFKFILKETHSEQQYLVALIYLKKNKTTLNLIKDNLSFAEYELESGFNVISICAKLLFT